MSQQKVSLIFKISSSLSTAIFDYGIYGNWQMNVYLTSALELNIVKFHSGTITQISPHSAWTRSAIQLLVDRPETYTQTKCALLINACVKAIKKIIVFEL